MPPPKVVQDKQEPKGRKGEQSTSQSRCANYASSEKASAHKCDLDTQPWRRVVSDDDTLREASTREGDVESIPWQRAAIDNIVAGFCRAAAEELCQEMPPLKVGEAKEEAVGQQLVVGMLPG